MSFIFHSVNVFLTLVMVSTSWCAGITSAAEPEILWSHTRANGGTIEGEGLLKGNGVVLSSDEQSLWVTAESGSITVLEAGTGMILSSFRPQEAEGHSTESRSSTALYEPSGSVEFAVYAVIDLLESHGRDGDAANDISSRIILLNGSPGEDIGTPIWSASIEGVVEGTPVIASDGERIYVTSNTALHGIFTVLNSSDGTLVSQTIDPQPMAHYGPLSMITNNGVDKLFWVDSTDRGYATRGRVHVAVSDFLSAVHSERSFDSSSIVAPTLSSNGKRIWAGGRSATVHGWDETSVKPTWSTQLSQSNRNESYPIVNTIETDDAQSRLFVASASNSLHCIDAENGNVLWTTNNTTSVFMTGVKYSAEYNFVYSIEHLTGTVRQHDADTGVVYWAISCEEVTMNPICQASVEAGFSVASDGVRVFYGDVYGRINAVKFSPGPPSESPSSAPSESPSSFPSLVPSAGPSVVPSAMPSSEPSTFPSDMPSMIPSFMPTESEQPSSFPSSYPSLLPSEDVSDMPSPMPSVSPAPTLAKDTRGRDPPTGTGNDPKTWEPDGSRVVTPTSTAGEGSFWFSTWMFAFSFVMWL